MTRKQIATSDRAERQVIQTKASIQYLRTGRRRRTPRAVNSVAGVRPFFP
jgi:hypothetical protein